LNGITVTGTLEFSRIAGTYYLMLKAATCITGAGTMNVGTSLNPIPFDAKHTITGGNGWYITGTSGLTLGVYAAEPLYKYVRLSNAALNGATTLEVDTDLTGDIWASGDLIYIGKSKSNAGFDRVINTITATTITVTVGISSALDTYSIVVLIQRNVNFLEAGGTAGIIRDFSAGNLTLAGGEFLGSLVSGAGGSLVYNCTSVPISGGSFYKSYMQIRNCDYAVISGGVICNTNVTFGLTGCLNPIISGGLLTGHYITLNGCAGTVVSGGEFICGYIVFSGSMVGANVSGGLFESCTYVFYQAYGNTLSACQCVNDFYIFYEAKYCFMLGDVVIDSTCSYVLVASPNCTLYNVDFNSVTQHANYATVTYNYLTQSLNHEGVDGAYKAWTVGGIIELQSTTKPTGYAHAYQMALESADSPCFYKRTFTVAAGESVNIEVYLRKDAVMAYLPRVYLMESIDDPLGGASPSQTFTMTDSVDTWESDSFCHHQ
jgi:hypothetical protein